MIVFGDLPVGMEYLGNDCVCNNFKSKLIRRRYDWSELSDNDE
jgi:hypothetical protein